MSLREFYFYDPRVLLIPTEQLTQPGVDAEFAALLADRAGWCKERADLLCEAFELYRERTLDLSRRAGDWMPPRIRNIGLVREPEQVSPYIQILNTSTWTVYEADFDPELSNAEFGAYVLAHSDRMFLVREVTHPAICNAAWWFDRTPEECERFAVAAARSPRPDADGYRAIAKAIPWLRELYHEVLKPPALYAPYPQLPGTALLVPMHLADTASRLTEQWGEVFADTTSEFARRWSKPDPDAANELCAWLAEDRPPLLVTAGDGRDGRIVWDPENPSGLDALRRELEGAAAVGCKVVLEDLRVVAARTRAFFASLAEPEALPRKHSDLSQTGYTYLHNERCMITYNLHEADLGRLSGPDQPYARAMLAARTVHEWAHLFVDAGWVAPSVSQEQMLERTSALTQAFDDLLAKMPPQLHALTAADLASLPAGGPAPVTGTSPGAGLVRLVFNRVDDFLANLVAFRFLTVPERESYVRQNIRPLRGEHGPDELWRMLQRYLYEYQYLRFSEVEDARAFFWSSTWFDFDYIESGLLTPEDFDVLASQVGAVLDAFEVDETRFVAPQETE